MLLCYLADVGGRIETLRCDIRAIRQVHLGLIMVINLAYGLTTPPVGTALFVAVKVGRVAMDKIIPPLLPLLACMLVVLVFVTYFPEVYWWLPRSFGLVK